MKNVITIVIVLMLTNTLFSKGNNPFEGVIHYKTKITRQDNTQSAIQYEKSLNEGFDKKVDFFYKEGKHCYIWKPSGAIELLPNKSKYIYQKIANKNIWYKNDITKKNKDVISVGIIDKVDTIAGYECKILKLVTVPKNSNNTEQNIRLFYFNKDLFKINYGYIKNYKLNSQNLVYRKIKSACLRFVIIFGGCTVDIKAESVDFKNVDDKVFNLF